MDTRNGNIVSMDEYENLSDEEREYFIRIDKEAEQIFNDQEAIRERIFELEKVQEEKLREALHGPSAEKIERKRKKNMRNKPCPCGSGKKFKKCCMFIGHFE